MWTPEFARPLELRATVVVMSTWKSRSDRSFVMPCCVAATTGRTRFRSVVVFCPGDMLLLADAHISITSRKVDLTAVCSNESARWQLFALCLSNASMTCRDS